MTNRGKSSGQTYFFEYHNDAFFGLAREDVGLKKTKSKDRNYPPISKKRENVWDINKLNDELA